jgi:hypothetical protein
MSLEGLSEEQVKGLAEQFHGLLSDPKTRRTVQRALKELKPTTVFPELEVDDAVTRVTADLTKVNDDLRAELSKRDMETTRRELRRTLTDTYPSLKFEDIEKAMTDNGIANHETAAKFLVQERRLADPAPEIPARGGPMMMPSEAKQFFKNPTQTARRLASDAITDIMRNRRKA